MLQQWLRERRSPAPLNEAAFEELKRYLAPVSEPYLRRLLRQSRAPLSPLVEGVVQDTFENLERTLLQLSALYPEAPHARRLVVLAKEHAKLALRKDTRPEERQEKILWMMEWLENPPAFPVWLALRRRFIETRSAVL